ncbi:hypothetical protein Fmac_025532 [Flemingia macrophylla]|uniref:pectinesterase n=1 Tax=Flemingia macrophylla TaxID=520843 RepID=A0ABD1LSK5_9FABA
MQYPKLFVFIFVFSAIGCNVCESQNCATPAKTIYVSQTNFKTVQSAIDSVPAGNTQWIHIQISPGIYKEVVKVPMNKACIYLEGAGSNLTKIQFDDHPDPTFYTQANFTVASGISFVNTLNSPSFSVAITQAYAAQIQGDKCAFFNCGFLGVQDTLYDQSGRHYYKNCYIQGGIDFIFGDGQSIFETSEIYYSLGKYGAPREGAITAQEGRSPSETTGFVFKNCKILGTPGIKTLLGRSLTSYSRVIIANSYLSDVVASEGWSALSFAGHEQTITYMEEGNTGPGADQSKRVPWLKHLSGVKLDQFLNISYIDQEGWIQKLPINIFV